MPDTNTCHYCGLTAAEILEKARAAADPEYRDHGHEADSLRPYGPGGAPVCAACTFDEEHPERKELAQQAFHTQLEAVSAASPMGGAILDNAGNMMPLTQDTLDALGIEIVDGIITVEECDHEECRAARAAGIGDPMAKAREHRPADPSHN